ncbi:MAG: hypothetical protein JWL65_6305 [Gammaproteobacteria bacterium]|nr:hypothetical protein [Gammaproteobacteria bacterium]
MAAETVSVRVPEPHFTLFNAQRDGMPEVIVVNDALLAFPHHELFPWHLRVRLEVIELVENGMPSPTESELLFEIGDAIEIAVLNGRTQLGAKNALFLARSTWNEMRELLFQVHDPEIANSALQELLESRHWHRPWEYRMQEDPQWKEAAYVFALFPIARGSDA